MRIIRVQYMWRREPGFRIQQKTLGYYGVFHFIDPVELHMDGQVLHTRPNTVLITPPNAQRDFRFPDGARVNWIHASLSSLELLERYDVPIGMPFCVTEPDAVREIFRKLRIEYLSDGAFSEELQVTYFRELMIKLSRSAASAQMPASISGKTREQIVAQRIRMLSHPEQDWSVEQLASNVGLSKSRFHVVYKSIFGTSPIQELIFARTDMAKTLLVDDTRYTLAVIAEKLGYKNQYDFARQFKKSTGLTPGQYRTQNR